MPFRDATIVADEDPLNDADFTPASRQQSVYWRPVAVQGHATSGRDARVVRVIHDGRRGDWTRVPMCVAQFKEEKNVVQ